MGGDPFVLEILLRGAAVGGFAALGVGLWRGQATSAARWAGLLVCLGAAGYAVSMCPLLREALGPVRWAAIVFGYGVNAYVWQFVLVVFEDRRLGVATLAPVAAVTALGLYAAFGPDGREIAAVLRDSLSILLSGHALAVIVRGWRGDLVEARRRLRGPFLAAVAGYIIVQTLIDAAIRHGVQAPGRDLANAAALAGLAALACAVFLAPRAALFPARRRAPRLVPDDGAARLAQAMDVEQLWRREGLTIAALSTAVGVPEHRLRRLINDQLGHRNFTAFVNARRIAAACAILSDPARAQSTIAEIAFELGFGSLGPFNRAFRAEVGAPPREWRRRALDGESLAETSKPG